MPLVEIPEEITAAIFAFMRARDHAGWSFAECYSPTKKAVVWKMTQALTAPECEQVTEYAVRKANRALARFAKTGSKKTAKTAAEWICKARFFRWRYHELMGMPSTESDMPFPLMTDDEATAQADE